jgi:hypothetical protein
MILQKNPESRILLDVHHYTDQVYIVSTVWIHIQTMEGSKVFEK